MTDLNMFRAVAQSRQIIEEEFVPRLPPRLALEVIGTTPKGISATPSRGVKIRDTPRVQRQY